jgi:hypothetical protein
MTTTSNQPGILADLLGPVSIRVRPADTIRGIEGIRETAPRQVLTAIFRHPVTGADLPVTITLFQGEDPRHMGVGVYVTDGDGEDVRGTVLRWDRGVDEDPRIISWERAHCADDECGSPCSHRKRGRS